MHKYLLLCALATLPFFALAPSTVAAAQNFNNPDYKVSLNYSGLNMQTESTPTYIPVENSLGDSTVNLFTLYLKPSIYKGTNLEAAVFNLAANRHVDNCYSATANGQAVMFSKIRKVQGNSWHYALPNPRGSAAAGHGASTETYRLYKNNTCYEATLQISDFNRLNLDNPNSVWPYSEKKVFNRLGAVFNRLKVR
jgi:hypothetical protein